MKDSLKHNFTVFLLFITLFVLNGSEFFHHHENANEENHCQACLISHTLSATDVSPITELNNLTSLEFFTVQENTLKPELKHSQTLSDRAPPFNS